MRFIKRHFNSKGGRYVIKKISNIVLLIVGIFAVGGEYVFAKEEAQDTGRKQTEEKIQATGVEPLLKIIKEIPGSSGEPVIVGEGRLYTLGNEDVLELLEDVFLYLIELGYYRYKLENTISLPGLNKITYKFYTNRLLNALLDVSFNVTDAEFGSIMLVDDKTHDLYIKVSRGIEKDIVKNTRLKMGSFLAGLAAKEKKLLLLDDNIKDENIKNRLKRPEIKQAIVAPIQMMNGGIFGVMNLDTRSPSDKFTPGNVETLRQLVKLVAATFQEVLKD